MLAAAIYFAGHPVFWFVLVSPLPRVGITLSSARWPKVVIEPFFRLGDFTGSPKLSFETGMFAIFSFNLPEPAYAGPDRCVGWECHLTTQQLLAALVTALTTAVLLTTTLVTCHDVLLSERFF